MDEKSDHTHNEYFAPQGIEDYFGNMNCKSSDSATCIRLSEGYELRTIEIANKYSIPIINQIDDASARFQLAFLKNELSLIDSLEPKFRPVSIPAQQTTRLPRKHLLAQAIGRSSKSVLDATAGWGSDALLMSRMGFEVTAVERVAAVSAMLEDGILRNHRVNSFLNLSHCFGDARLVLDTTAIRPDTVYLDPMYPQGQKTVRQVTRRMEILKNVSGRKFIF